MQQTQQTVPMVPALIIVAIFTSIAGYMWGAYTHMNPTYDEPVHNFVQKNLAQKGGVSHGSAMNEGTLSEGDQSTPSFLVKTDYNEGMVKLTLSSVRNLPSDTQFEVIIGGKVVDIFSDRNFEFSFTPTKTKTPVLVTALNKKGEWIEGDDGEPLTARADIIQ